MIFSKAKKIIVGGKKGRPSSVINKLRDELKVDSCYNGFGVMPISGFDLIIWAIDVDNSEKKDYPVKDKGSVLICTKVMRDGYSRMDAVKRIFNMHGNAVIAIRLINGLFEFELIDALNNSWCQTTSISKLADRIEFFYNWTKCSIRKSIPCGGEDKDFLITDELNDFVELNKILALKVANSCGNRFFGNYSTRCTKLFPSLNSDGGQILMSPRNVNKAFITPEDFVLISNGKYYGENKPSVDAPVQLEIYKNFPKIKYIIHGHAYIDYAPCTTHYYPCGDLRELYEVKALIDKGEMRINLINHGFLIMGEALDDMRNGLAFSNL